MMAEHEFTQEDLVPVYARISRAMGAMPYGGMVYAREIPVLPRGCVSGPEPIDVLYIVAEYMEKLRDVLVGVAERSEADRAELAAIRANLRAVGDLTLAGGRLAALHEQLRAEPELRADPTGVDCAERYEGVDQ